MRHKSRAWLLLAGMPFAANAAGLSISVTHTGSFVQGQTNAVYLIHVTNPGTATQGPVTVTDIAPAGLTVTAMSGNGWICSANSCTNPAVVLGGQGYPAISVLVTVAPNAAPSLTNQATVATSQLTVIANDITTITLPVSVVAWGDNRHKESEVPPGLTNVVAIAAGVTHSLALRGDGTVVAWGDDTYGESDVPAGLGGVTSISAGSHRSVALKSDGTVVAWGETATVPTGLTNVVAVSSGQGGDLALTGDGAVVPFDGTAPPYAGLLPPPDSATYVTAIAAGFFETGDVPRTLDPVGPVSFALKSDGTVAAWTRLGQFPLPPLPPLSVNNIAAISSTCEATNTFVWGGALGLTNDGTIVSLDEQIQTNVTGVTAIAAGCNFNLALTATGAILENYYLSGLNVPVDVPAGLRNFTAIAAGGYHALALTFTPPIQVTFAAPNGVNNLAFVQVLYAAAPNGGGQPFCFVTYDVRGNALWLYGDKGFWIGPIAQGAPSIQLQNSLCAVNTQATNIAPVTSADALTLNLNLAFKQNGTRNVYTRTRDISGEDTGLVQKGTFGLIAEPLGPMGVHPNSGTADRTNDWGFQLNYGDPFTALPLGGWNQFLVATSSAGGGNPFCFVHYDRAAHELWMYSSDVGYFLGPVEVGTQSDPVSRLNTSACSAFARFDYGQFTVYINFHAMTGSYKLFQRMLDTLNRDSGFVQTGTVTIQ